MMNVTKACLFLEVDGMTCVGILDGTDLTDMCMAISSVHPKGVLPVKQLNDTFHWENLSTDDLFIHMESAHNNSLNNRLENPPHYNPRSEDKNG